MESERKMTKYEFLGDLSRLLSDIPKEEREQALSYYEDYFADAGKENEEAILEELGTPQEVAKQILEESEQEIPVSQGKIEEKNEVFHYEENQQNFSNESEQKKRWTWDTSHILLAIILAVVAFPALFAGVCAVGSVLLGVVCALFFGSFGIGIAGICLCLSGGVLVFVGIASITAGVGTMFLYAGVGLLLFGIGLLMAKGSSEVMFHGIPALFMGIKNLAVKIQGKRGQNT